MSIAIPLITSLVALAFALSVLDQYFERRKPFQLVWSIALFLWFIGSGMQFLWEAVGPTSVLFRLWYLTGAALVPAYLGTGTIYLLANRRVAHGAMATLLVATLITAVLVFIVALNKPLSALEGEALTSRGFFPGYVTALTIILNTYGTIALIGGALWSGWIYWRRREATYRVVSNVLIAAGVLVAAAGGALGRLSVPEPHSFALLLGVLIIYLGFLRSQEVFTEFRIPLIRWLRKT